MGQNAPNNPLRRFTPQGDRLFVASNRLKLFLVSLGIVAFTAPSASAALKKYEVRHRIQLHYSQTSPKVEIGIGAVGVSVFAMGIASIRCRKEWLRERLLELATLSRCEQTKRAVRMQAGSSLCVE